MIAEEILRKIRRIEILSKKIAQNIFAGEYHSAFKGRGMEFSEVREYQPGDDVRFIDRNVSSRLGKLFVKQYVEERELTIILAIDLSASLRFFSSSKSKKDIAAEISALIAFTAMLNNDKVGLLIFSDRIELLIAPKKGHTHLLRMIRDIIEFQPQGRRTSVAQALSYINQAFKKRAIVFILSDFLDSDFVTPLKIASRKHDCIAINIGDCRETTLPKHGSFILRDYETDQEFLLDCDLPAVRQQFQARLEERSQNLRNLFSRYGIDYLTIRSEQDYEKPLFELFLRRRKKLSR